MHKTAVLLALLAALPLSGQLADGDQQWSLRAEGHAGGRANPARIDAAIAAYERAVAANPNDLVARWKLLRSYRFKGQYAAPSLEAKKQIYTRARNAGEQALAVVDRLLAARGLAAAAKAPEKQVASVARSIPGAGEVFLWDSINWGEWALAYGKMAAARQGAADRIRREATIALLIDAQLEGGTPARVLGRLHDQTPRIPFITGWASSREAVRFLRESLKIDPSNKITKVFLAEAMVSNDSGAKGAAIALLREVVSAPNDPQYEVEQAAATDDARALLKAWGN